MFFKLYPDLAKYFFWWGVKFLSRNSISIAYKFDKQYLRTYPPSSSSRSLRTCTLQEAGTETFLQAALRPELLCTMDHLGYL
jgi:hypothetical protein